MDDGNGRSGRERSNGYVCVRITVSPRQAARDPQPSSPLLRGAGHLPQAFHDEGLMAAVSSSGSSSHWPARIHVIRPN